MLDRFAQLLEVSTTVAAITLALIAAQLATQAYPLVDLVRREAVRDGKKCLWALVIALGSLPGAIAYLLAGRPASRLPCQVPGRDLAKWMQRRRRDEALSAPTVRRGTAVSR
jgi:hypothetical protein